MTMSSAQKKRRGQLRKPAARKRLRARLWNEQGGKCYWCSERMTMPSGGDPTPRDKDATFEHVVDRAKGGAWGGDNVKLACYRCNMLRSGSMRQFAAVT